MKILLISWRLTKNLGGPSLLPTTMRVIDEFLEDTQYTVISPTSEDLPLATEYGVSIIPVSTPAGPSLKKIFVKKILPAALAKVLLGISFGSPHTRNILEAFTEADIIVDIMGIVFVDSLGSNTLIGRALEAVPWLVGKIFGKPVIKYTADLGPFENRYNRFFSKLYLQCLVDLILARSDMSRQNLVKLGVTTPVMVCPDTAFLLEPQTTPLAEKLATHRNENPVVGFSVSHMAARQSGNPKGYIDSMASLADFIVESIGAKIVLIPNELSPDKYLDDLHYSNETWSRMIYKEEVLIISEEYTAPQLKGIIRQCDVMVANRYHSVIASLSQAIPVLVIGWHHKYIEVLNLVGQGQYLCSVKSLASDDLKRKFAELWEARERIRYEIEAALPEIRQAIFKGGEEVSRIYGKRVSQPTQF